MTAFDTELLQLPERYSKAIVPQGEIEYQVPSTGVVSALAPQNSNQPSRDTR
ncbi:hypothetical protein NJ7G_3189 [Natrinema sp. J7-2]|nr:hypothetical protein NJ7G_3189 [Natrinema sp. J7-2]